VRDAKSRGFALVLPQDTVVTTALEEGAPTREVLVTDISEGWLGADIGAKTIADYSARIARAKTVLWNGPMGVFELPAFRRGTDAIARALVAATEKGATTVVGGGDSAAAIEQAGLADRVSHVSTGGGASLEFLEGKMLPGVAALTSK
jgi:3-phosphoglycerate kinase